MLSRTEKEDPNLLMPYTDKLDAIRAKVRRERRSGFGDHQRWGDEWGRGERVTAVSTPDEHEQREARRALPSASLTDPEGTR